MALTDTIRQAQNMGASSDVILAQIAKQNAGTPMATSIVKAQQSGAKSDDILGEIVKQNAPAPAPAPDPAQQESGGLLGSITNFGRSIGDSLYSGVASHTIARNVASHSQDIQTLSDHIAEMKKEGKDTSHAEYTLKTIMQDSPDQYGGNLSAIIPSVNKTNEQIIGEASGTLTDLLTGAGALSPMIAGSALGLTHALQQNKGVGGALVDTAVGALGGKIAEVGFNAVSPFLNKVVAAYGTPILEKLSQYIPEGAMPALQKIAESASIGEGKGGTELLDKANKGVNDILDSAGNIIKKGAGATKTAAEVAADAVKAGAKDFNSKIIETPESIAKAKTAKLQSNIEAINTDLTGKAKVNAYKDVVSGNREVTPSSVLKEQELSPSQQTINVSTRLHQEIPLKDGSPIPSVDLHPTNHAQNLTTLKNALNDTETRLGNALTGDKEMVYNLDKSGLVDKIDMLKTEKPGDFIGDNGKIYNNVVEFGKKQIVDAEDTIAGGRDARSAFDAAAKKKFPSAFKDGTLDPSTPAGHAIKAVRDTINEHIYDTAPNGSDVKALIGREADIFRARDSVALNAAKKDGFNSISAWAKSNPKLAKAVGMGLTFIGGGIVGREVIK